MKRWFVVVAAGLLVATGAAVIPAVAGTSDGPVPLKWRRCPAGTATTGSLTMTVASEHPVVSMAGAIAPCEPQHPNAQYAVVAYGPGGQARMLRYFDYHPAGFQYSTMAALPDWTGAVCLVTYYDVRVSCQAVAVVTSPPGSVRLGGPVRVDDPLVNTTLTREQVLYWPRPVEGTDPCPECYVSPPDL